MIRFGDGAARSGSHATAAESGFRRGGEARNLRGPFDNAMQLARPESKGMRERERDRHAAEGNGDGNAALAGVRAASWLQDGPRSRSPALRPARRGAEGRAPRPGAPASFEPAGERCAVREAEGAAHRFPVLIGVIAI